MQPRGRAKRARLVAAAERCFLNDGFRAATIAQIAEVAEVPQGNVYYYFKSKDALASAVVSAWRTSQEEVMDARPSAEALVEFVERELRKPRALAARGNGALILLSDLERAGSPAAEELRAFFALRRAFLQRCVEAALDDVERSERVPRITDWLLMAVAGVQSFVFTQGQPSSLGGLREDLIAQLRARLR